MFTKSKFQRFSSKRIMQKMYKSLGRNKTNSSIFQVLKIPQNVYHETKTQPKKSYKFEFWFK